VDAIGPTSKVTALPAYSLGHFSLHWSGSDNSGGSGLAGYDVYVSDNGAAFRPLLRGTTLTSLPFTGTTGHSYRFYSVATDKLGNRQRTPSAQASTTIKLPASVPGRMQHRPEAEKRSDLVFASFFLS